MNRIDICKNIIQLLHFFEFYGLISLMVTVYINRWGIKIPAYFCEIYSKRPRWNGS